MADAPAAPAAAPAAPAVASTEQTPPAAPVTTPATPPEKAPPAPDASRLLAEARRAERAIQGEKRAWKEQRAREEAQWKERVAKAEAVEAKLARVSEDPLAALEILGVSYENLSLAQLNDGKPPADLKVRELEKRIADAEKKAAEEKAAEKKKAEEALTAQQKATLERWHAATTKKVVDAGDKYELINALGYSAEVGKMVEEHYDATGEEVSWEKAAERLEAHLQAEQEPAVAEVFKRLTNTKWFKSRYAPVAKEQPAPAAPRRSRDLEVPETKRVAPPAPPAAPPAPTITHRMTASSNPRSAAAATRAELRARAQALIDGKGG